MQCPRHTNWCISTPHSHNRLWKTPYKKAAAQSRQWRLETDLACLCPATKVGQNTWRHREWTVERKSKAAEDFCSTGHTDSTPASQISTSTITSLPFNILTWHAVSKPNPTTLMLSGLFCLSYKNSKKKKRQNPIIKWKKKSLFCKSPCKDCSFAN